MIRSHHPRAGYAVILVVAFLLIFLSFLGITYRQLSSTIRADTLLQQQQIRDEGCLQALAKALTLLETGVPPTDPYICGITISTIYGPRSYTITYTATDPLAWSISVTPTVGHSPAPIPTMFLP